MLNVIMIIIRQCKQYTLASDSFTKNRTGGMGDDATAASPFAPSSAEGETETEMGGGF